ncbi:MAG: universal stress protein [Thermodesulfovibrionia bacterium]|nr:universal stress protein [Thermodesulfovibrionia bacterium]
MRGYRKILIAVNGSKDVLTQGLKLAHDESCWVTVVKVIPANEGDFNLLGVKNIEDVLNSGSYGEVAEINSIAKTEGALIKTRLEEGEPYKKILEAAEEERCDVIIMGMKKRNWLRKLFGDNTVGKVINQAPCPVFVVGA